MRPEDFSRNTESWGGRRSPGDSVESRVVEPVRDTSEVVVDSKKEFPKTYENGASSINYGQITALPAPAISNSNSDDSVKAAGFPLAAGDIDLIEKVWVDRAKKIVADTKDDPYEREVAVNQLQVDYQKKRYGRQVDISK